MNAENKKSVGGGTVLPSMFRCAYWMSFLSLCVAVLILVGWSIGGSINEYSSGGGVIMGRAGYAGISTTGAGVLSALDIKPGDVVHHWQVVGRIYSNSDVEALVHARTLMEHHKAAYERNLALVNSLKDARKKYSKEELKRLDATLERQKNQIDWYADFLKKFPSMAKRGAVSQFEAKDAQDKYDARLLQIDADESARLHEYFDCDNSIFSLDHDLYDFETIAENMRTTFIEQLNTIMYRSRVFARCSGRVVNVNVDEGDVVKEGQEIARVTTDAAPGVSTWHTYAYFSAKDARDIEPGMPALVTPSTVEVEQDGSIRGLVVSVSEDMETEESIYRTFRSQSLAHSISAHCMSVPVRIDILLTRDPTSPSGFAWTSGAGPNLNVVHGTICSVKVKTRSHSPMSIMLGLARRTLFGDGILETKNIKMGEVAAEVEK